MSPLELQSAMAMLNFVGPSAFTLRQAVASVPGNAPAQHKLTFDDFCRGKAAPKSKRVSPCLAIDVHCHSESSTHTGSPAFVYYVSGIDNVSPMQLRLAFDIFDQVRLLWTN